jgi:hypothetical protein
MPATELMTAAAGFGGTFLGFIGGVIRQRKTAESDFSTRVIDRLNKLEEQVEECRKRDGHIAVLGLGMKMVVPELQRLDRANPVLKYVADAFSALPVEDNSFEELINKLKDIP